MSFCSSINHGFGRLHESTPSVDILSSTSAAFKGGDWRATISDALFWMISYDWKKESIMCQPCTQTQLQQMHWMKIENHWIHFRDFAPISRRKFYSAVQLISIHVAHPNSQIRLVFVANCYGNVALQSVQQLVCECVCVRWCKHQFLAGLNGYSENVSFSLGQQCPSASYECKNVPNPHMRTQVIYHTNVYRAMGTKNKIKWMYKMRRTEIVAAPCNTISAIDTEMRCEYWKVSSNW